MKQLLILVLICLTGLELKAQTAEEFLHPQQKQGEYLILQIGALKLHSALIKKSAAIIGSGLASWNTIKSLEEDFHLDFFNSYELPGHLAKNMHPGEIGKELISKIQTSQLYWKKRIDDDSFSAWSDKVHATLARKVSNSSDQLALVFSDKLMKASEFERAQLLESILKDFESYQSSFNQIQQIHNAYMEQITVKRNWIRSSVINY